MERGGGSTQCFRGSIFPFKATDILPDCLERTLTPEPPTMFYCNASSRQSRSSSTHSVEVNPLTRGMGYRSDIPQYHIYTKTPKTKIIDFHYKSNNKKIDPRKKDQNITTKNDCCRSFPYYLHK